MGVETPPTRLRNRSGNHPPRQPRVGDKSTNTAASHFSAETRREPGSIPLPRGKPVGPPNENRRGPVGPRPRSMVSDAGARGVSLRVTVRPGASKVVKERARRVGAQTRPGVASRPPGEISTRSPGVRDRESATGTSLAPRERRLGATLRTRRGAVVELRVRHAVHTVVDRVLVVAEHSCELDCHVTPAVSTRWHRCCTHRPRIWLYTSFPRGRSR